MTKPKFIDLFAGCGGLSLGLSQAGWKGVLAVEKDHMAFETLKANLIDGTRFGSFEWPTEIPKGPIAIQELLAKHLQAIQRLSGNVELIAGGPPCQGFSYAGKRDGADPRNQMLTHYVRIVGLIRPKFILIENVKGITAKHSTSEQAYADVLKEKLQGLRYKCLAKIVRASDCFVPQERPRYILLGVNLDAYPGLQTGTDLGKLWEDALQSATTDFLETTGLENKVVTSRDALSDLEIDGKELADCPDAPRRQQITYKRPTTRYQKLLHGDVTANDMNSMRLAKHADTTIARFSWIQNNCRSGVSLHSEELANFATKKQTQVVLNASKPSHTLTTLPDDLIHYSEPRILTVREYARLQSFPDWYAFHGKYTTGC